MAHLLIRIAVIYLIARGLAHDVLPLLAGGSIVLLASFVVLALNVLLQVREGR